MSVRANTAGKPSRLRLRLTASAEAALRSGHPWVFADSVREQNREGLAGELAVVFDRRDRFLAVGLFDPGSPIRLRVLDLGRPVPIDEQWWTGRLAQAIERRRGLFDDRTTGFRLINGESDGWPGLVLDHYHDTLVLKLYTAAWLPRLSEITTLIHERLGPRRIILRLSRNTQRTSAGHSRRQGRSRAPGETRTGDGEAIYGSPPAGPVVFFETGLKFEAEVMRGQKTGFFLDQRENRRQVELLVRGRRVLNAFSFTGGFSLYAARGGAASVTDLDLSPHALAGARRNFKLNDSDAAVGRCSHTCVQAEAFEWLGGAGRSQFDCVILDPPSFAKRESERIAAIRAYERLVRLGARCLGREGLLVACSCSAHVTAEEFFQAARRSVGAERRKFAEIQTTGHAPDHPATFKEAEYLKAIYLVLR